MQQGRAHLRRRPGRQPPPTGSPVEAVGHVSDVGGSWIAWRRRVRTPRIRVGLAGNVLFEHPPADDRPVDVTL